jgi:hypothetical protein
MSAMLIESSAKQAISGGVHAVRKTTADNAAVALTLDSGGTIRDCSGDSETLFNYRRDELLERHVSLLLPELETLELVRDGEANPRLRFQCRIGCHFAAVKRNGEHFASALFLNFLDNSGDGRLSLIVRPAEPSRHDGRQASMAALPLDS